ncbi:MAG: zf-HC2 domain-containing protein [Myxococcota bacterium]
MSCHPEHVYAIYADGELTPEERRPLESHLVGCRRCRELVVALREEAELLGDVLLERPQARPSPAPAAAPARGIALGIGPVLLAGLGGLVALGWLLETVRPAADRWIAPFNRKGVSDMAFDLIFLLRDEAPAAFEVGLAVAAMASVSALLTFALTMLMRRWQGPGMLLIAALLALAFPAAEGRAHFGMHEHEDYTLPAGETHDGTLVISADTANVDGNVAGDLLALSNRLTIRGEVDGNVVVVARQLEIPGRVRGSVYSGSARAHVADTVDGNFYTFSEAFTLAAGAKVERDTAALIESAVLEGTVGRDLFLGGDDGELRGTVGRNVMAWLERLALLDGARVGGDVDATIPEGEEVEISSGARIAGELVTGAPSDHRGRGLARYTEPGFYVWLAVNLAGAFAVGMLLRLLLPAIFEVRVETPGAFLRTLGVGFIVLVAMPAALLVMAVTLVGIPLALIGLGLYLASLYVGSIVVAGLVGMTVVHPRSEGWGAFGLALLAGLALTIVAANTPFVGILIKILVVLLGLGLITERSRTGLRALRA